jgi:hypothetical protein
LALPTLFDQRLNTPFSFSNFGFLERDISDSSLTTFSSDIHCPQLQSSLNMTRVLDEQDKQAKQGMPNSQATEHQGNQHQGMTTDPARFIVQLEIKSKTPLQMTTEPAQPKVHLELKPNTPLDIITKASQPKVQRQLNLNQITNTNSPRPRSRSPTKKVEEWDPETLDVMVDHLMSVFHTAMDISTENPEPEKTPEYLRRVEGKKNLISHCQYVCDSYEELLKHLNNPTECLTKPASRLWKLVEPVEPSVDPSVPEAQPARPSTLIAVLTKVVGKITADSIFHSGIEEPLPSFLKYIRYSYESTEKLQTSLRSYLKVADPSAYNPRSIHGIEIWYYPQDGSVDECLRDLRGNIDVFRTEIVDTLGLPQLYLKPSYQLPVLRWP